MRGMAHFEEKSGVVYCRAPWGQWFQTMEEVCVEVRVEPGTRARDIKCVITSHTLTVSVASQEVIKGALFGGVVAEDSVWTLEDHQLLTIVLVKSDRSAANCWHSLLQGQWACDPLVLDQMEKKLTLERFHTEHPGFDFSGAEITGNYTGGGPQF